MSILNLLDSTVVILLLFAGLVAKALINKYGYGIHQVKGPAWAAYTDWWRLFVAPSRRPEQYHIRLHEKCGDVENIIASNDGFLDYANAVSRTPWLLVV